MQKRRKARVLIVGFLARTAFTYLGHRTKSTPEARCLDVVGEWFRALGRVGKSERVREREREREREAGSKYQERKTRFLAEEAR